MYGLGPPNRILFVTDIECIENFPFKIPMNKTYLVICSAISDALRLSIDSSSAFYGKRAVVERQESYNEISYPKHNRLSG